MQDAQETQVPFDPDFDKPKAASPAPGFTLQASMKQVFLAGVGVGVMAVASLGFILLLVKGDALSGLAGAFGSNGGSGRQVAVAPSPSDDSFGEAPSGEIVPVSDKDHVRGDKNAAVTLIEYSDFQCPFCSRFHPTMQQVMDQYKGKVRWVYRHFPLNSIHPDAQKAAEAAECAAEQGKFWEMADKMFEKQASGLAAAQLSGYAKEAGVKDVKKFESCVTSGKYAQRVADDLKSGEAAGVTGTPGTFVVTKDGDPQLIPGALPFSAVQQMVDSILKG